MKLGLTSLAAVPACTARFLGDSHHPVGLDGDDQSLRRPVRTSVEDDYLESVWEGCIGMVWKEQSQHRCRGRGVASKVVDHGSRLVTTEEYLARRRLHPISWEEVAYHNPTLLALLDRVIAGPP